jgi:hypothetical protein
LLVSKLEFPDVVITLYSVFGTMVIVLDWVLIKTTSATSDIGIREFKHTRQNFAVAYFVICDVGRFVSWMSQTTNLAIGRQFVVVQSAFLQQSTSKKPIGTTRKESRQKREIQLESSKKYRQITK